MDILIFSCLLLFYIYLGVHFWNTQNIRPFVFWTVLLPFTSAFVLLHTKFQISVYYGLVVAPILFFVLKSIQKKTLPKIIFLLGAITLLFVSFYLPWGFLESKGNNLAINILKDLKPPALILSSLIILNLIDNKQLDWNGKFAQNLLQFNFFTTIFFFLLLKFTNLLQFATDDPFYAETDVRYMSMGCFFAIFYFIAKMASKEKITSKELILILTPIFLTGNRTFFVIIAIIFVVSLILEIGNVKLFFGRLLMLLFGIGILFVGIINTNKALTERIFSLFSPENLVHELMEKRFSPFFIKLESFEWYNYLIGKGLGDTFFIPWFTYRANIDDFNVYMDNIYMTLFTKYGVGMSIPFFLLFFYINKTHNNKKFKVLVIVYFTVIGLTTSFMYQTSFLFILLLLASFRSETASFAPIAKKRPSITQK